MIDTRNDLQAATVENAASIRMAIYWSALGHLDVYTQNSVQTISGSEAESKLAELRSANISVEVLD